MSPFYVLDSFMYVTILKFTETDTIQTITAS